MPLFEMSPTALAEVNRTTFHEAGVLERTHLQAVLRDRIDAVAGDVLVVAEEFGEFHDANRRIDLLGLDRSGRLVVIELKRTEDGGHMELQALRYAAMVRTMTLERLTEVYESHLSRHPHSDGRDLDARTRLTEWLADADEFALATDVAVVLVSASFGREITGTVLWLNEHGLDIRCVKLEPYRLGERLLLDIQQVIPLPEATDYQVRIRAKEVITRPATSGWNHDLTKYVVTDASGQESAPLPKRRAVLAMAHALVGAGVPAEEVVDALPPSKVRRLDGLTPADDVASALADTYPSLDVGRWFTDEALPAVGAVVVISKMFGAQTEGVLRSLAAVAPHSGVTFAAASADG